MSPLSQQGQMSPRRGLLLAVAAALVFGASNSALQGQNAAPTLERHTVQSDGHAMALWEKSPDNPTTSVLLLHGRTWSTVPNFDLQVSGEDLSLMDGLNEASIRTYGLDARGYGATPRDETGWLTPDRAARDVLAVLEWIRARDPGAPAPVLFGWSYGSMVAQLAVQRRPDLVSGVVLFGYPYDPANVIEEATDAGDAPRRPTTAEGAASDFIVEGAISNTAIETYVQAALEADPVRVDFKNLHEWNELDPAKVGVPTLVMEGEFDPITDTDAHARLFTSLGSQDRTWTVIPGGAHAAFLERPRPIFLDALIPFIQRVGSRPPH